jgi:hypothetical protein
MVVEGATVLRLVTETTAIIAISIAFSVAGV